MGTTENSINFDLEADYLVIGAGASGIAFTDQIINRSSHLSVIIVDRRENPGGHWNNVYEFVTLHQPAAFYGVNSEKLEKDDNDLSSYAEIRAYYENVMMKLLNSKRVRFFPRCEYKGNGEFVSKLEEGLVHRVKVKRKIVDASFMSPTVPSYRKVGFTISNGVNFVPVNELSCTQFPWKRYVIIGAGKTGVDAILYLLREKVSPSRITWVISRDNWYVNRSLFLKNQFCQSGMKIANNLMEYKDVNELYEMWEKEEFIFRLDKEITPIVLKGAFVTAEEMENLRHVTNIVRKGRIEHIEQNRIVFKDGSAIEIDGDTLNVDCSADGTGKFDPQKVFNGNKICLQTVRINLIPYSAAVIAEFEIRYPEDEERKNAALKPISRPQTPNEFIICLRNSYMNAKSIEMELGPFWDRSCRLHPLNYISLCDFVHVGLYLKWYESALTIALDNLVSSIESKSEQDENV